MQPCKLGHPRYKSVSGRLICRTCRSQRERNLWRRYRIDAIQALGGVCVRCGANDLRALEIDHVTRVPGTRAARTGAMVRLTWRKLRDGEYDGPELQVLCGSCHNIKTLEESWVE